MSFITIDYRDRKLIYEQLVDNVKQLILRGDLKKDDFLPSVRSLAKELGINPNTIQKAYAELERQGIIASLTGRGSIVILDKSALADTGRNEVRTVIRPAAALAHSIGMKEDEFSELAAICFREYAENDRKESQTT